MRIEKAKTEYASYRIPGMVMTGSGALVAYYECRRDYSDWAQIDVKVIRSADGGKSWRTVLLIDGNGDTLNNPLMIADGDTLHFLYCRNYRDIFYRKSVDGGVTFSPPRDISAAADPLPFFNVVAVGPGHGIVKDGALIAPMWVGTNRDDPKMHHPSYVTTLYSQDDGESWRVGEPVFPDEIADANESALALTANGEALISIRHRGQDRVRAFAKSADGKGGWYGLRFARDIPDPKCQGSMFHTDGRIYHLNCADGSARVDLTLRVSGDCFETFDSVLVDEAGGYSDLAVKDGRAYILYEKDTREGGLYFKEVNIRLFNDGRRACRK